MSKIKNIAIVWESETGGGVNSYIKYLLDSKDFSSKSITIFTNSENKGAPQLIKDLKEKNNISFVFYKSFFVFNRSRIFLEKLIYYFLKPLFLLLLIFKFKKILAKKKFDILICQCGNYGIFRSEQAAIIAAKKINIPVISAVIHHACVKPPIFFKFTFKIIDYYIKKSLTSLITVSEATRETVKENSNLLNNTNLKNKVIHNGVPKNHFKKDNYLNITLNKNEDTVLKIGMVSRLSEDKGHEDLIKAFSSIPLVYQKKLLIIIVGEDYKNQKKKLQQIINNLNLKDKVRFLDYVNLDSKKIILSLDLFLSLTRNFEGFGLSVAEAMSVGTPVLATDVGAVNEFLNEDCGQLIKPKNIEGIKSALINFCDNKKIWDSKAQVAKSRIEKNFSADEMGKKYIDYFESQI